jgi:hypothetical protein
MQILFLRESDESNFKFTCFSWEGLRSVLSDTTFQALESGLLAGERDSLERIVWELYALLGAENVYAFYNSRDSMLFVFDGYSYWRPFYDGSGIQALTQAKDYLNKSVDPMQTFVAFKVDGLGMDGYFSTRKQALNVFNENCKHRSLIGVSRLKINWDAEVESFVLFES